MARKKSKTRKEEPVGTGQQYRPRPFWSGVIAFGLVNLPVSLFPANRGRPLSLNIADEHGNRLRRMYFCEKEERALERDDIVRGYPVDAGRYVIVEDEELEALAPDKTREIDLRRFVSLDEVNPVYFERGYFLAPDSRSTKAYRLLARSMEEEQRVGLATFVMRDREYLVAIMSERGILRAETLRFHDEIRSPRQVGLPEQPDATDEKLERRIGRAIQALSREKLDPDLLVEQEMQRLRELLDDKLAKGEDVIDQQAPDHEDSNVIDLMQVLKERLRGQPEGGDRKTSRKTPKASRKRRASRSGPEHLNRDELYEKAREKRIPGRSNMNKEELAKALKQAG